MRLKIEVKVSFISEFFSIWELTDVYILIQRIWFSLWDQNDRDEIEISKLSVAAMQLSQILTLSDMGFFWTVSHAGGGGGHEGPPS